MAKANVYISFDHEHDRPLRDRLFTQGEKPDSSFQMTDSSVEELLTDSWKIKVRERLKHVDQVIFICGERTHRAKGVALEYSITREEGKPYFLLQGRENKATRSPRLAPNTDKIYAWTDNNLQSLVGGLR